MSAEFNIIEHTICAAHIREYPRATARSQDVALLQHVKQYVPKDNPTPRKGDITIVGAHGVGYPKELYEPLWDDLQRQLRARGIRIRSIWVADAPWQCYSGLLNEGDLGNDPSWNDYARDIAHMINVFRMPRPLFAAGHSFGAAAMVHLSLQHPRLFHGMLLLEPFICFTDFSTKLLGRFPAASAVLRRDTWPSRESAADHFRKSKLYGRWDPRALDKWIEHGVRGVPGSDKGEVTLLTSKHQEQLTYIRLSAAAFDPAGDNVIRPDKAPDLDSSLKHKYAMYPMYRPEPNQTMASLAHLRPAALYVTGDKSFTRWPEFDGDQPSVTGCGAGGSGGLEAGRVKQVTHPDCGHDMPMEAPWFCASEAAKWLALELDRWWAEEREFEQWARKPLADKIAVEKDYMKQIEGLRRGSRVPAKI
ncbi:hypothetical protein CDD83_10635 [Cordyceps sp. RAO-2017]|nr:hypothetical protein CDD83_10635 [Cordyceps sp. RAO-2017]